MKAATVVNALLSLNEKLILNPRGKKNALLSYVFFPPFLNMPKWYYLAKHNNRIQSKLLTDALSSFGYRTFLYNYLDAEIDYGKQYDLFIGHNKTFAKIANKINPDSAKILITTGCHPYFDAEQLKIRAGNLYKRKGVKLSFPIIDGSYVDENFSAADYIFMLGNDFMKRTWPAEDKRVYFYNNISLLKPRKKSFHGKNFIFFGSSLQLRRGLDLVLEVFSKRKEKLYVCSPFKNEPDFVSIYKRELYECPNIIPVGFVNMNSKKFRDIINDVDFAIMPSCSEAQSSSVLNMMMSGLIPVITENVGFDNVYNYGILIKDGTISGVTEAVEKAVSLSDIDVDRKRDQLFLELNKFTPEAFLNNFASFLRNTMR